MGDVYVSIAPVMAGLLIITTGYSVFDPIIACGIGVTTTVGAIITDPQYLAGPYATTNHFKKIPDGQGWDPTPCRADQVR